MVISSVCVLFWIHFIDSISQPRGASVKTNKSLQLGAPSASSLPAAKTQTCRVRHGAVYITVY